MNIKERVFRTVKRLVPKVYRYTRNLYFKNDLSFFDKINVSIDSLYRECVINDIKFVGHNSYDNTLSFKYKNNVIVTDYSVGTIIEIFCLNVYKIPLDNLRPNTIVLDVGMNKGFSSLRFALNPNVIKVIGFEVDYDHEKFIKLNISNTNKVEYNLFGISDTNGEIELYTSPNDDGVTTIDNTFYSKYWNEERKSKVVKKIVKVKKASDVVKKYLDMYKGYNFVLKIDVEGAEYSIFEELNKEDLINKFYMITGEVHSGYKEIEEYFKNYTRIENDIKVNNTGLATFTYIQN